MRAITVQHKNVLQALLNDSIYTTNKKSEGEYLNKAYDFMKNVYEYKTNPIFLSPVGFNVEMYGATFDENSVAIELDIPEEELKIQEYYSWSDFIYFLEYKKEFADGSVVFENVEDYGESILTEIKSIEDMGPNTPYQLTAERLKKEWIISYTDKCEKLSLFHDGSGGNNVLKELNYY